MYVPFRRALLLTGICEGMGVSHHIPVEDSEVHARFTEKGAFYGREVIIKSIRKTPTRTYRVQIKSSYCKGPTFPLSLCIEISFSYIDRKLQDRGRISPRDAM
jgi:hypothetical protein